MAALAKTATEPRTAPSGVPIRHVAAVSVGNALGFYDFLTYVYFAVYIGRAFFPAHNETASLLSTYGASFVGFLARPVGAMIIGPMGDRIGRKTAMMLSFTLMGIGVLGVALTPSYARIGIAAPLLVIDGADDIAGAGHTVHDNADWIFRHAVNPRHRQIIRTE